MTELLTAKPENEDERWRLVIFDSFGKVFQAGRPSTWDGLLRQVGKWKAGQRGAMFPSWEAKVFLYRDGVWRGPP
jgi:hypothetical protein